MAIDDTIKRINELYHKSKGEGLTPEEQEEQARLRREYVENIKAGLTNQLEHTYIKHPDGSLTKVEKRK